MNKNQEWRMQAACYQHPLSKEGAWDIDHEEFRDLALDVCFSCPVRRACYDDAVQDHEAEGLRGGSMFKLRPLKRVREDPMYGVPEYAEEMQELRNE